MLLEVKEIHSFYGTSHILFGVCLGVGEGKTVCLLGRNGTGKSTTLKSIIGLVSTKSGSIKFHGEEIRGKPPFVIARKGIGYVPEDRRILQDLTVRENLEIAQIDTAREKKEWTVSSIFELFPILEKREAKQGGTLSGGEQQMLTIARTLMTNPRLLLLDEPSQGLAPLVLGQVQKQIGELKAGDLSILLAEQRQDFALGLSDHAYIIEKGLIKYDGLAEELNQNVELRKKYLGV